jgi:lipid A disaccharide synthetase
MSLANLALGHAVVPELHRRTTTSERLSREACAYLTDPSARDAQGPRSAS